MNFSHPLRLLRAVLLAALPVILFAGSAAPALTTELQKGLATPEQMLAYLVEHRQDISLASYSVRPDGTPDPADTLLLVNPGQKMPLGSTFKVVVLAAYAREVAAGRLDPAQTVTLRDWERFYLPGSDGGAHPAALRGLGIAEDRFGFAMNRDATVTLDGLARVMIHFSDNAATDYLMARLGRDTLKATIDQAGLTGQDVPLPILGIFLSWTNHVDGLLTPARVRRLLAEGPARYTARVDRLTAAYGNPKWRRAEHLFLLATQDTDLFQLEAPLAGVLFQQGTVRDYAQIMAGVVTGTFLSPQISSVMRRHLEVDLANHDTFLSLGSKGGSLAGVVTVANYLVPAGGDFAGKPRVSVLFLRRLSQLDELSLLDTFAEELFAVETAIDGAFVERVREALVDAR